MTQTLNKGVGHLIIRARVGMRASMRASWGVGTVMVGIGASIELRMWTKIGVITMNASMAIGMKTMVRTMGMEAGMETRIRIDMKMRVQTTIAIKTEIRVETIYL